MLIEMLASQWDNTNSILDSFHQLSVKLVVDELEFLRNIVRRCIDIDICGFDEVFKSYSEKIHQLLSLSMILERYETNIPRFSKLWV